MRLEGQGMDRVSVVIATMDREEDLRRCLESLWLQTYLPHEVIIVDDGSLDAQALKALIPAEVEFQYHRKRPPGLSASRNLGAKVATGDLILFLDDDVVLEPTFIEEIVKVFREDPSGKIGGVSGVITNKRPKPRWFSLWARLFFLDRGRPGELFPWGFFSEIGIPDKVVDVDWIPGGMSCFRKRVFCELALSDMGQRGRHGLADVEFSWRVSKKYQLKVTPSARLAHYSRGRDPKNAIERGRRQLLNHGRIFLIHGGKGAAVWVKFLWASIGLILGNIGASLISRNPEEKVLRFRLALGNLMGLFRFLLLGG